jgi:hypothetical protein
VVGYVVGWVYEFPDGGVEVVLQTRAAAVEGFVWRGSEVRSSAQRSVQRSKRVVARFCRFHNLHELWTLTLRPDDGLALNEEQTFTSNELHNFFKRFKRATGETPGPYIIVEEFGKLNGRRHFHAGCDWSARFGAVEVCEVCATPNLRRVRWDIPPAGSLCIGCLWGHGFVGQPRPSNGRALSQYLSKYLVSDLFGGGALGANRYRVALGFQPPEPVLLEGSSFGDVRAEVERLFGGGFFWWDSETSGRDMPRTVVGTLEVEGG